MEPPFIACADIGMSPCPVMKTRELPVRCGKLALKIKIAFPCNLTSSTRSVDPSGGSDLRGNWRKRLSTQVYRPQQTRAEGSKGRIVVDDQDGGSSPLLTIKRSRKGTPRFG
jgi:hypothetical protein